MQEDGRNLSNGIRVEHKGSSIGEWHNSDWEQEHVHPDAIDAHLEEILHPQDKYHGYVSLNDVTNQIARPVSALAHTRYHLHVFELLGPLLQNE
jgi:hypothetical protein